MHLGLHKVPLTLVYFFTGKSTTWCCSCVHFMECHILFDFYFGNIPAGISPALSPSFPLPPAFSLPLSPAVGAHSEGDVRSSLDRGLHETGHHVCPPVHATAIAVNLIVPALCSLIVPALFSLIVPALFS